MKKIVFNLFVLLAMFSFSSCIQVEFKNPQPEGIAAMESFPDKLVGTYLMYDKDTVHVFKGGLKLNRDSLGTWQIFSISKNLVVKDWNHRLFINIADSTQTSWILYILDERHDSLFLSSVALNSSDSISYQNLKKICEVEAIYNSEQVLDLVRIDPSQKQLKKILKKVKFIKLGHLKKI